MTEKRFDEAFAKARFSHTAARRILDEVAKLVANLTPAEALTEQGA